MKLLLLALLLPAFLRAASTSIDPVITTLHPVIVMMKWSEFKELKNKLGFLYVFNDKTGRWDRVRPEQLCGAVANKVSKQREPKP